MKRAVRNAARKRAANAVGKAAKKGVGFVAKKVPVIGAGCFAYDWANGGFGHAVD